MINSTRLVQTFIDLVKIDSPSGEEKEISKYVVKKLLALGGATEFDSYGNIIAKFKGVGKPILLNSHLDTVEPGRAIKPKIVGDKIVSDGTTILGGDAKAGVAIILEVLESFGEDNSPHLPIEAVFTLEEETGLHGAINLDYTKIHSTIGITLDGTRGPEHIITSAPGYVKIDAIITGRGAHAGFEPEKGISAISIASEIISQLKVGKIDHQTSANIGLIRGGSARNAIAETVSFEAEIRSRSIEKLQNHTIHFQKIIKDVLSKYPEAKIALDIQTEFDPYIFEENHHVIQKTVKALKQIGLTPQLAPSGGGADVSIFQKHGIEAICIGAGYHNPHTTREYVSIKDMVNGAKFCKQIVLTV